MLDPIPEPISLITDPDGWREQIATVTQALMGFHGKAPGASPESVREIVLDLADDILAGRPYRRRRRRRGEGDLMYRATIGAYRLDLSDGRVRDDIMGVIVRTLDLGESIDLGLDLG